MMWSRRSTKDVSQNHAWENFIAPQVITIDGLTGTGRSGTGLSVAAALGVRYVDDLILVLTAQRLGVQPDQLAIRKQTLTRSFPLSWSVFSFGLPTVSSSSSLSYMTDEDLFQVQRDVITEVMRTTGCVIAGWQASRVIARTENVVRVFLHADLRTRIDRFRTRHNFDSTQAAQKALNQLDCRQTEYFKRMFRQDVYQAFDYQLTIDTTALPVKQVTQLILEFVKRSGRSTDLNDSRNKE